MGLKIQLTSAEVAHRPQHQHLIVAFLIQNVSQRFHRREKGLLGVHGIGVDGNLQREAGSLGEHGAHGPGSSRHAVSAVQAGLVAGEVFIILRQLSEARNQILGKGPTVLRIREGELRGLQKDINEVPLLFRKLYRHSLRIHVMAVDKVGNGELGLDIGPEIDLVPSIGKGGTHGEEGSQHAEAQHPAINAPLPIDQKHGNQQQRHQKCREDTAQQKFLHHTAAGAGKRCREMVDDFIHRQLRPGIQKPLQGKSEKGGQKAKQHRQHCPHIPKKDFFTIFHNSSSSTPPVYEVSISILISFFLRSSYFPLPLSVAGLEKIQYDMTNGLSANFACGAPIRR